MVYIMIDPGHGGGDPGASGYGLQEKLVSLQLSKFLYDELRRYEGVEVDLTRWNDQYLSLDQRCDLANDTDADLFISMHCNSFSDSAAAGYESYVVYGARDYMTNAARKQDILHKHAMKLLKEYGVRDRGKKEAGYYVLRYTRMSAILFENLFITNQEENKWLADKDFLTKMAQAYAAGIAEAYQLQKKADDEPGPVEEELQEYWRVIKDGEEVGVFDYKPHAILSGSHAARAGLMYGEKTVTITYERVLRANRGKKEDPALQEEMVTSSLP
ncbi:N-acetylmuramoyl-L-alanine amidase [Marininema mesophilum]|uniref:N-acetylmuramoyl-L-alanine amidase n=1 Tax=Marininema mesophilum TaxID=1048340 RepID=A0A1H2PYK1_9BACL|nr:N-acetylmuramoyl-L-alanine amidase [Marininema mesophilum]SDV99952.1 N-acetylmuramoyl-L-alanine amidase [Marininema mesophilum]